MILQNQAYWIVSTRKEWSLFLTSKAPGEGKSLVSIKQTKKNHIFQSKQKAAHYVPFLRAKLKTLSVDLTRNVPWFCKKKWWSFIWIFDLSPKCPILSKNQPPNSHILVYYLFNSYKWIQLLNFLKFSLWSMCQR